MEARAFTDAAAIRAAGSRADFVYAHTLPLDKWIHDACWQRFPLRCAAYAPDLARREERVAAQASWRWPS